MNKRVSVTSLGKTKTIFDHELQSHVEAFVDSAGRIYYSNVHVMLEARKLFLRIGNIGAILQINGTDTGMGWTMNDIKRVIAEYPNEIRHADLLPHLENRAKHWLCEISPRNINITHNAAIGMQALKAESPIANQTPFVDIIDRIGMLDRYESAPDFGIHAGKPGVYVISISDTVAAYGCVSNLGATLIEKIREYRRAGLDPVVLYMRSLDTRYNAERLLGCIDVFVEQHAIGFTDKTHGKFMNTSNWTNKLAVINSYVRD